jgi:16S rRNA (guanine966-N2)-methyltransferase
MRILEGRWAGRHLTSPADRRVRPTAEAVRGAWLAALEADFRGGRVVDLFAGTGALGLEALSRGARYADLVETRPSSLHALKANIAALRARDRTRLFRKDALGFADALEPGSYAVAFADPPYESRMLDRLIEIWAENRFASVLSVEHALVHELPPPAHRIRFEETVVSIYRNP